MRRCARHCADLGLADNVQAGDDVFDPLTAERAVPWHGKRPSCLAGNRMIPGAAPATRWNVWTGWPRRWWPATDPAGPASALVIEQERLPSAKSWTPAARARDGIDAARPGRTVHSGGCLWCAQHAGRPEVLPTGRNFFSIDSRALPTPVAWRLGWASADALLDRHLMDHGNWPRAVVLSVWGTSNMRTGGDDHGTGAGADGGSSVLGCKRRGA